MRPLTAPPSKLPLVEVRDDRGRPLQVQNFTKWLTWINNLFEWTKNEDWHDVGDTGEPAFENSWANRSGEATAAFYIDGQNRVHIKGGVDTGTNGTTVFTLPTNYRPDEKLRFVATKIGAAGEGMLTIDTDGTVDASIGNANGISINVSFRNG